MKSTICLGVLLAAAAFACGPAKTSNVGPDASDVISDVVVTDVLVDVPDFSHVPDTGADLNAPDAWVDPPGSWDLGSPDTGHVDLPVDHAADVSADASADIPVDLPNDPGLPPDVHCWPGDVVFPDFERGCTQDAECGLAFHRSDCCGSIVVRGIRADRLGDFKAAEDTCTAQWPACGCAARISSADDGSVSGDPGDFEVRCESGQCLSRVLAGCGDLQRRVDVALAAVGACGVGNGCVAREIGPVCGSFSCRQVAVASNASNEGLAALDVLGGEGMTLGCQDFHCGCGYLGVPACVEGQCSMLSPGDDCDAVKARFDEVLADPATLACGKDADCAGTTMAFAPFCSSECACAVVTNQAATRGILAISARWQDLGCPTELCSCAKCATVLRCVEGRCKGRL